MDTIKFRVGDRVRSVNHMAIRMYWGRIEEGTVVQVNIDRVIRVQFDNGELLYVYPDEVEHGKIIKVKLI